MTEQAVSPLRRRMIEDMSIRKFAGKTQHDYVQRVKEFATFLGRSPDTAKSEDVRRFRLHLTSSGAGTPKINATVMTLDTNEFMRRFLMHVLPQGFHRIRYYGLLTSPTRAKNIARIRELLAVPLIPIDAIKALNPKAPTSAQPSTNAQPEQPKAPEHSCPCCGGRMRIIETFRRGQQPKASRSPQHRPTPLPQKIKIDTS